MSRFLRLRLAPLALTALAALPLAAQPPAPPATPASVPTPSPAPAPGAVAASVNGQAIPEAVLQRSLERVPPAKRGEARPEVLNYMIDNVLVDQYLVQAGVKVEKAEVDKRIDEIRAELKQQSRELEKFLQDNRVSEAELRDQIAADLRWDRFAAGQATDKALRELFENNKEMFDQTTVRARHILLTAPPEEAKAKLLALRKEIEDEVAAGVAKLPPEADALAREKARMALVEEAFGKRAEVVSACPSRKQAGDVGWFQRAGFMVEPFSRAAFALKPFQMSDVVVSQFGSHLILVTDRKPGLDVKYEDVKDEVRETFCDRLRDSVVTQMRTKSQIVVTPLR